MKTTRGSVLVQVLVTAVLVLTISAGLLRLTMSRAQMSARNVQFVKARNADAGALANLMTYWASVGMTCSNPPGSPYSCAPAAAAPPGICPCTCTPNMQTSPPTLPTISATGTDPNACLLTIVSPD